MTAGRAWLRPLALMFCAGVGVAGPGWAQPAPGPGDARAFDRLADEIDNTDLVLNTGQAIDRTLARLHALLPPGDQRRALRYQVEVCFLKFSDARKGLQYAGQGLRRARQVGDRKAEANFLYCRGVYREMGPQPRDAIADYEAGIGIARKLEDRQLVADGYTMRGSTLSLLGEQALALRDFLDAQRIYEQLGLSNSAVDNLINIAAGYRRLGQYDKAVHYLDQAATHAARRDDVYDLYAVAMQRAFMALDQARPAQALTQLARAQELVRKTGQKGALGGVLLARADAENGLGRFRDALADVQRARAQFAQVSDGSNTGMLELQQGRALAGLGRRAEATRHFDLAEADLSGKNLRYLVQLYAERAANQEAWHHPSRALRYLKLKIKADAALARITQAQYATLMGIQFDSARRELENRKLAAEKQLRDQQLASLEKVRHWQGVAITLGSLLVLLLLWLAVRQFRHGRRYRRLAMTDALTGIANRRRIEELAHEALRESRLSGQPLSLLAMDIDHFKQINDACGHVAGDQVLVKVVEACQCSLRQQDRIGRVGGEEFVVLLPATDREAAWRIAERIRLAVAALSIPLQDRPLRVTVSLGVTTLQPDDNQPGDLVQRADAALYRAKQNGRDRVEVAEPA